MRWTTLLLLAVVLVGLSAAKVRADNPTVTITATDNTMANKITADGSYTLPDDGTTVRDITVVVRPTGGVKGQGGTKLATINQDGKKYSGTVTDLPAGKYDVQVIMRVLRGTANEEKWYSDTKTAIEVKNP